MKRTYFSDHSFGVMAAAITSLALAGIVTISPARVEAQAVPGANPVAATGYCDTVGTRTGTSSSSTNVTYAAYVGGGSNDALNVAQVAANCLVYTGGRITGSVPVAARRIGAATTDKSTGVLTLATPKTGQVLAAVRFGNVINDAQLQVGTGDLVVASDTGLAVLSPDLATTRWQQSGAFTRASVGPDGTVAALTGASGKQLTVYSATGAVLFTRTFTDSQVNDVAVFTGVTPEDTRFVVTGFAQRDGGGCTKLQVAWIRTYNLQNELVWKSYDWTHAQAFGRSSSCADTRGYRVEIGLDKKLYFAGEAAGGNSIYRYLSTNLQTNAPNAPSDAYNNPYNTGSNHITYVARLDPLTGAQSAGSFLLSRLTSGRGNTIRPRAITADQNGAVYVGGISAAHIQNRANIVLNGKKLQVYTGGDPWLLILAPDMRQRRLWIALADGGQGEVQSIGVGSGTIAVATRADRKSTDGFALYTTPGVPATYTGTKAGHLTVIPGQ
ncbi:hypothetical protein [Novosphingobium sp.]|uniref:hypothetical protein n=1 Tax=Novosphingobium sp. TaxID=1874826 RepID=UPI001DD371AB|nr:hypothetical protein [Novosphingobium sp.]MBX9665506.1 hypothetical protein [Novosphingobium sp.]